MEMQKEKPTLPKLVRRCFEYVPGQTVARAGRYRCATCSTSVYFETGDILPDCPLCGAHIRVWVGMRCGDAADQPSS